MATELEKAAVMTEQELADLHRKVKAKNSELKEWQSQIELAEKESAGKIEAFKKAAEVAKDEYEAGLKPLQALKDELSSLKTELQQVKDAIVAETVRLEGEQKLALKALDMAIDAKRHDLVRLAAMVSEFKSKIASM